MFALIFVQGFVGLYTFEKDTIDEDLSRDVVEYFGSVTVTSINLYMAVTGGTDWSIYYHIVKRCGAIYEIGYVFYIFFFSFALFNVLKEPVWKDERGC